MSRSRLVTVWLALGAAPVVPASGQHLPREFVTWTPSFELASRAPFTQTGIPTRSRYCSTINRIAHVVTWALAGAFTFLALTAAGGGDGEGRGQVALIGALIGGATAAFVDWVACDGARILRPSKGARAWPVLDWQPTWRLQLTGATAR